ncbi:hypothetical protein L1887_15001 [Cichorium endivia]|nr:hypothetical protein L1887_15001 [Cichorium endivia]
MTIFCGGGFDSGGDGVEVCRNIQDLITQMLLPHTGFNTIVRSSEDRKFGGREALEDGEPSTGSTTSIPQSKRLHSLSSRDHCWLPFIWNHRLPKYPHSSQVSLTADISICTVINVYDSWNPFRLPILGFYSGNSQGSLINFIFNHLCFLSHRLYLTFCTYLLALPLEGNKKTLVELGYILKVTSTFDTN